MMTFSLKKYDGLALLLLRLVIGIIFLYHGMQKWNMEDPSAIMTILKFAEPLGGIALILGVLTQLASIGFIIIMLGAIYMKATGFGQGTLNLFATFGNGAKWEFDLILLAGCVVLLVMGAGAASVESKLCRK